MITQIRATIEEARARAAAVGVSNLLMVGTMAGIFSGFIFVLANMWYAPTQHLPAVAPFHAVGAIFYHDAAPQMTPAYAIVVLVNHFSLSIAFGLIFALLVVPLARNYSRADHRRSCIRRAALRRQRPDPRAFGLQVL